MEVGNEQAPLGAHARMEIDQVPRGRRKVTFVSGIGTAASTVSPGVKGDATTAAIAVYRYLAALHSGHPDPVRAILGDIGQQRRPDYST